MSKRSRSSKGDVVWCLPNKKRPIAYSTVAAEQLILAFSEYTLQEAYNAINYDSEAKAILKIYIENGYGADLIKTLFR